MLDKNSESTLPCSSGAFRGAAGSSQTATTSSRSLSSDEGFWSPMNVLRKRRSEPVTAKGKKKQRLPSWTHTFVCLSETDQECVPSPSERATLQMAGLGEKKMVLDGDGDAQAIYDELLLQFPKLKEAGGFELLRTQDKGSKTLHIIDMPQQSYSVPYLRAVVHSARIFIRPLQRDLSLLPDKEVKIGSTHFA